MIGRQLCNQDSFQTDAEVISHTASQRRVRIGKGFLQPQENLALLPSHSFSSWSNPRSHPRWPGNTCFLQPEPSNKPGKKKPFVHIMIRLLHFARAVVFFDALYYCMWFMSICNSVRKQGGFWQCSKWKCDAEVGSHCTKKIRKVCLCSYLRIDKNRNYITKDVVAFASDNRAVL